MTGSAESAQAPARVVTPEGLVAKDEQIILAIKPSGWFVLVVSLPALAAIGAITLAAALLGRLLGDPVNRELLAVLALAAAGVRLVIAAAQWLARFYVLTDRRVLRVKGVLHVRIFEAPLTRIQNTFLSLTLLERILGIGTIIFATAGSGAPEAAWLLIARPGEIHELVVETIRRAQSRSHGEKP